MRQKHNGFTKFMRKIDDKELLEPEVSSKEWYYGASLDTISIGYLLEAIEGDPAALFYAFIWRYTPQGHDHWAEVYELELEYLDEDIAYMKWLLELVS